MDQDGASPSAPAAPTAPSLDEAPTPGEERARRLRTQAKVAGFMMMLLGAFCVLQFGSLAYAAPHFPEQNKALPGGNLTIAFPAAANAQVQLTYASGAPSTNGTLDAAGNGTFHATNATFTVKVKVLTGGQTWTRTAFVPAGFQQGLALEATSPKESKEMVGLPSVLFVVLWVATAIAVLVTASGYFAFKLRAPRLAMTGAFVFVMGATLLLSQTGFSLFSVSLAGTAVLSFAFIYRARTEFSPLRASAPAMPQPPAPPTPPAP